MGHFLSSAFAFIVRYASLIYTGLPPPRDILRSASTSKRKILAKAFALLLIVFKKNLCKSICSAWQKFFQKIFVKTFCSVIVVIPEVELHPKSWTKKAHLRFSSKFLSRKFTYYFYKERIDRVFATRADSEMTIICVKSPS